MNITEFLSGQRIEFQTLQHPPTYDAQRTAQALHMPGDHVAKTVLLRGDADYVVAVLPATHAIDFPVIKRLLGVPRAELATEPECSEHFPDCETGAVPPFGSQYGMRTLMDESLTHGERVVLQGNTHDQAISMRTKDFIELEHPTLAAFSHHT